MKLEMEAESESQSDAGIFSIYMFIPVYFILNSHTLTQICFLLFGPFHLADIEVDEKNETGKSVWKK